jgi:hypothetical protein
MYTREATIDLLIVRAAGDSGESLSVPCAATLSSCRQARGVSTLLQGQLDAFNQQIMDFPPFIESDLP